MAQSWRCSNSGALSNDASVQAGGPFKPSSGLSGAVDVLRRTVLLQDCWILGCRQLHSARCSAKEHGNRALPDVLQCDVECLVFQFALLVGKLNFQRAILVPAAMIFADM